MSQSIVKKYIKLKRKDISYVKFIFEGYEDFATITTIDNDAAVVRLAIMPDFVAETRGILEELRKEIDLQEIDTSPLERKNNGKNA